MISSQAPVSPHHLKTEECSRDLCPSDAGEPGKEVGKESVDGPEDVVCEPCGDGEDDQLAEGEAQRPVTDPGTPTAAQRAEHELTHWPYRSWWKACVAGMATGRQHRSVVGEAAECNHTRVIMDFAYLTENTHVTEDAHGSEQLSDASMTMLVLTETRFGSVWAYATEYFNVCGLVP